MSTRPTSSLSPTLSLPMLLPCQLQPSPLGSVSSNSEGLRKTQSCWFTMLSLVSFLTFFRTGRHLIHSCRCWTCIAKALGGPTFYTVSSKAEIRTPQRVRYRSQAHHLQRHRCHRSRLRKGLAQVFRSRMLRHHLQHQQVFCLHSVSTFTTRTPVDQSNSLLILFLPVPPTLSRNTGPNFPRCHPQSTLYYAFKFFPCHHPVPLVRPVEDITSGKVLVIKTTRPDDVRIDPVARLFDPREVYLLIDGCIEFAIGITAWMPNHGARHIYLLVVVERVCHWLTWTQQRGR